VKVLNDRVLCCYRGPRKGELRRRTSVMSATGYVRGMQLECLGRERRATCVAPCRWVSGQQQQQGQRAQLKPRGAWCAVQREGRRNAARCSVLRLVEEQKKGRCEERK
jgi:hypothetical protein